VDGAVAHQSPDRSASHAGGLTPGVRADLDQLGGAEAEVVAGPLTVPLAVGGFGFGPGVSADIGFDPARREVAITRSAGDRGVANVCRTGRPRGGEMIGRRRDAWFENEQLALGRRRLMPWSEVDVMWIPLAAVLDIRSRSPVEQTKRHAQVTVQNQAAPYLIEVFHVRFTLEQWLRAGSLMRDRDAAHPAHKQPGPALSPRAVTSPRPAIDVPSQRRRQAKPKTTLSQQGDLSPGRTAVPATPTSAPRSKSTPVMRADDGKRRIWLWIQNGKIHASLAPVGNASQHRLNPAEVSHLLLAEPSRAMPAIRTLTGIADDGLALARMRSWRAPDRIVVSLSASDLAGRQIPQASQRPAGMNPDGSVRTVSGGLPTLGKRHR
jgi:hypothetical protein